MARFERLPAYDIRICHGCGDGSLVPTVAWIDHVTGHVIYCYEGDAPIEDLPQHLAAMVWDALPETTPPADEGECSQLGLF